MADGVFVTLELMFKSGAADQFCESLSETLAETARSPGFKAIVALRDNAEGDHLLVVEQWESQEAHQKYMQRREKEGALTGLIAMLEGPPVVRTWRVEGGKKVDPAI